MWCHRQIASLIVPILFGLISFSISQSPNPQEILIASGQNYNFRSQNYPLNYPVNSNISIVFTSLNGTTLIIECPTLNVPCTTDYLAISITGDTTFTKYCRDTTFTSLTSITNKLLVNFISGSRGIFSSFVPGSYRYQCNIRVSDNGNNNGTSGNSTTGNVSNGPCTCGIRNFNETNTRIVGGSEANRGEIPWRVLLSIRMSFLGPNLVCGGSIISPNWVMTAAHCTNSLLLGSQITVIYGSQYTTNDGKKIVADRYVQNPNFNQNTMDWDMTLIHLPTPLTFDNVSVSQVCLPWNMQNETFDNVTALASGWGTLQPVPIDQQNNNPVSKTLMKVELPVLSSEHCQQQFPTLKYITNNMLCTYLPGKDTCQGDSGGSIDYQPSANGFYYGIGVVSFGEGCAQNDKPGVYSKVTNFLNWIQLTTNENFCKP